MEFAEQEGESDSKFIFEGLPNTSETGASILCRRRGINYLLYTKPP